MKNSNTPLATQEPIRLLTIGDLSELLNIGLRTVARMRSDGRIPKPVRIGGSVRWRSDVISAWFEANCPDCRKKGGAA